MRIKGIFALSMSLAVALSSTSCAPAMQTELGPAIGVVVLNCGVTPQGIARDCRVVHEEPVGMGFGQRAIHGAEGRMDLDVDGGNEVWTEDSRVQFPIRFAPLNEPPPQPRVAQTPQPLT